jgi:hypothetical protein
MEEVVKELEKKDRAYFRGKKVQFVNNATYFQCMRNPALPDTFIIAQAAGRNSVHREEDGLNKLPETRLQIQTYIEDSQLFNSLSKEPSLITYAKSEPMTEETVPESKDTTLISFWSKNSTGQYHCANSIAEVNVLKRPINIDRKLEQALFKGCENQVFFFDEVNDS